MEFVTVKELNTAFDNLNEWLEENSNLKITEIRLRKCNQKEVTFNIEYEDLTRKS